jgi:hypothetical protein
MSTGPESDDQAVPTLHCRVCEVDVPAGAFCGLCGVNTVPQRGDRPEWLRIKWFGAAPGEHVLRPSLASSLFPQLPPRARTQFRVVLVLWVLALAAFVLLRLPAGLIAVGAFGLPLLSSSICANPMPTAICPPAPCGSPRRWVSRSESGGC